MKPTCTDFEEFSEPVCACLCKKEKREECRRLIESNKANHYVFNDFRCECECDMTYECERPELFSVKTEES